VKVSPCRKCVLVRTVPFLLEYGRRKDLNILDMYYKCFTLTKKPKKKSFQITTHIDEVSICTNKG